ncbi:ileal sodium/bile acid cotransporter-like isoform X1 [Oratosquilla oratoria]|uniref:ileal sodium/bile acid cotransporter-like isoform X1 n=1 Tax=Oratosquilla oratoria TaxID=337810 RepID=UPI003F75C8F9
MDSNLFLNESLTSPYSNLVHPAKEGNETIIENGALFSKEWLQFLDRCNSMVILVNLIMLMLGMGAATYWRELLLHAKRPVGCVIGMISQFGILPAVGFGLTMALNMTPYESLGVLLICCSPGGAFSNFFTYWVDGDLALSILMTTTSSLLAFGGMPFNLWLYTQRWSAHELKVPYMNILASLAFMAIPAGIGMVMRSYTRVWAERISKICGFIGWIITLFTGFLIILTYWHVVIKSNLRVVMAAAAIPIGSVSLGYVVAKIFCSTHKVARTIGIETGCQNIPVTMNVIVLSFSDFKIRGQLVVFPILYAVTLLVEIISLILVYQCWRCSQQVTVEDTKSVVDNTVLTSVPVPQEASTMNNSSDKGINLRHGEEQSDSEMVLFLEPQSPTEKSTQTEISVPVKIHPFPVLPPGVPFLPRENTAMYDDDEDDVDGRHVSLSRQSTLPLVRQESVSIVRRDSQRRFYDGSIPIGQNDLDVDDGRFSPSMRFNSFRRNQH